MISTESKLIKCFIILGVIFSLILRINAVSAEESTAPASPNAFWKFLDEVEFTTRVKTEFDDNSNQSEDNEKSHVQQILSQEIEYKKSREEDYKVGLEYRGDYAYSHRIDKTSAVKQMIKMDFKKRLKEKFSLGFNDEILWFRDVGFKTFLGDRLLEKGFMINTPTAELAYEFNPRLSFVTNFRYRRVDFQDKMIDDIVDHERQRVRGQVNYLLWAEQGVIGFAGFERERTIFLDKPDKSSVAQRPYLGLIKGFPNLFDVTGEVGYAKIDMDDGNVLDDNNVDVRISLDSNSLSKTYIHAEYQFNVKEPSLRTEYSQYGYYLAKFEVEHALNPKTDLIAKYSYEFEDYDASNALVGQADRDRKTRLQTLELGLHRHLNNWLTLEFSYGYGKRDTDFEAEGFTQNKYGVAVSVKY